MTKHNLSKQHRSGQVYMKFVLDYLKERHDISETIYQNAINHFLIGSSFLASSQQIFYENTFNDVFLNNELTKLKTIREIQLPTNLAEAIEMDL